MRVSTSLTGREAEVERKVELEQEKPAKRPPLDSLVPRNDELFAAMEFILLGSPERQILQGGDLPALERTAEEAARSGNGTRARIEFESAARVALFEQNKDKLGDMLERADEFSAKGDSFSRMHQILLKNLDKAMGVAREYYSELATEQKAAEAAPTDEHVPTVGEGTSQGSSGKKDAASLMARA
jgi:hypothetical protein